MRFHFVSEVSRRVLLAKTQFAATPRVLKPPDPAVEIPDFHIAGVQELACGPQGLRVRFGVDRSVRRNAVVCIDQVSPIGRRGDLLSQDNA